MGKSTISMVIFHSFLYVYQRVHFTIPNQSWPRPFLVESTAKPHSGSGRLSDAMAPWTHSPLLEDCCDGNTKSVPSNCSAICSLAIALVDGAKLSWNEKCYNSMVSSVKKILAKAKTIAFSWTVADNFTMYPSNLQCCVWPHDDCHLTRYPKLFET